MVLFVPFLGEAEVLSTPLVLLGLLELAPETGFSCLVGLVGGALESLVTSVLLLPRFSCPSPALPGCRGDGLTTTLHDCSLVLPEIATE